MRTAWPVPSCLRPSHLRATQLDSECRTRTNRRDRGRPARRHLLPTREAGCFTRSFRAQWTAGSLRGTMTRTRTSRCPAPARTRARTTRVPHSTTSWNPVWFDSIARCPQRSSNKRIRGLSKEMRASGMQGLGGSRNPGSLGKQSPRVSQAVTRVVPKERLRWRLSPGALLCRVQAAVRSSWETRRKNTMKEANKTRQTKSMNKTKTIKTRRTNKTRRKTTRKAHGRAKNANPWRGATAISTPAAFLAEWLQRLGWTQQRMTMDSKIRTGTCGRCAGRMRGSGRRRSARVVRRGLVFRICLLKWSSWCMTRFGLWRTGLRFATCRLRRCRRSG